jgi:hypothetical protein
MNDTLFLSAILRNFFKWLINDAKSFKIIVQSFFSFLNLKMQVSTEKMNGIYEKWIGSSDYYYPSPTCMNRATHKCSKCTTIDGTPAFICNSCNDLIHSQNKHDVEKIQGEEFERYCEDYISCGLQRYTVMYYAPSVHLQKTTEYRQKNPDDSLKLPNVGPSLFCDDALQEFRSWYKQKYDNVKSPSGMEIAIESDEYCTRILNYVKNIVKIRNSEGKRKVYCHLSLPVKFAVISGAVKVEIDCDSELWAEMESLPGYSRHDKS